MITLATQVGLSGPISLGTVLSVEVKKQAPTVETRSFLHQRPLRYPQPFRDWTPSQEPLVIFPESPGSYRLEVEWRADGKSGFAEMSFQVESKKASSPAPTKLKVGDSELWAPSPHEAEALIKSKRRVRNEIAKLVEPGDVVYDVGANIGFYAMLFAQATGATGKVFCVEANPVCVQLLHTNMMAKGMEHVDIVPVALMHYVGATGFTLNYGNTNLGLSDASGFSLNKPGLKLSVPCFSFDRLVEDFRLRRPDVIKIDVEGVEGYVIEGMAQCLSEVRPRLLMELHGKVCATAVFNNLDQHNYLYSHPTSGKKLNPEKVCQRDEVIQVLAKPAH